MTESVRQLKGTVVPTLRYRDVPAAIEWLCAALGLEKHHVVAGEDGSIRYAQLAFGDGLIMLGPVEGGNGDGMMAQPEETGGLETQICYLFVDDARAHCARAKAAGADIVLDIDDEASDGRGYSCRDPEGHIWNFGTYDPRQCQSVRRTPATPMQVGVRRLALVVGILSNAVTTVAFLGWLYAATEHRVAHAAVPADAAQRDEHVVDEAMERALRETREQLFRERSAKETAERAARDVRDQLGRERAAKEQAERLAVEARDQLAREKTAKAAIEPAADLRAAAQKAERAAAEARERVRQLEQDTALAHDAAASERAAREASEQALADVKDELGKERSAREAAAARAKDELAKERGAREAAERSARQAREQAAAAKRPVYKPKASSSSSSSSSSPFGWQ